jgi:hypothetical protein
MQSGNAADEDWELLVSFFPKEWRDLALRSGALKGLRQDKSEEKLLRVLLLHVGGGLSMRETVVRARQGHLANLSAVALFKRLRKSGTWLQELCQALFEERGLQSSRPARKAWRLVDSTVIKEPGKTGSLWRIHYSLRWPSLKCDYFKITSLEGEGNGDSLMQFPLKAKDYVLADRGYCQASGIHFASRKRAYITVRLNPDGIRLQSLTGAPLQLAQRLESITKTGQIAHWEVLLPMEAQPSLAARLCVVRKSRAAAARALKKLKRRASKTGATLQAQTLLYANYVMVLTTFPSESFPPESILDYYRFRWQIELVFKRFKQIAQLGHLPKYDQQSSKAWLYGKLFVALLTEKLIYHAGALSPWGYSIPSQARR